MTRTWLIGNRNAGQGRHQAELDAFLKSRPHVTATESADEAETCRAIARACDEHVDRLIVFGGDGTVHCAVREIVELKAKGHRVPTLAILPGGSANDFARGIGSVDFATAADAFDSGNEVEVDLIQATLADGSTEWIVNAASGGIGGEIREAMSDELKAWWGRFSYARLAATVAPSIEPYRAHVTIDGKPVRAEATAVLVMNSPSVGGTMLMPVASPSDGAFDVAIITASGPAEMLRLLAQFLAGTLLAGEHLQHVRGTTCTIESTPPMPFLGDGEPIGPTPVTFKLVPRAIRVIAPRLGQV